MAGWYVVLRAIDRLWLVASVDRWPLLDEGRDRLPQVVGAEADGLPLGLHHEALADGETGPGGVHRSLRGPHRERWLRRDGVGQLGGGGLEILLGDEDLGDADPFGFLGVDARRGGDELKCL